MGNLRFDSTLVVRITEDGLNSEDVERRLASVLFEQGCVKDSFAQAVIDREASYPTALDMGGLNVAIPHCDIEHVISGALCVGVLAHPVDWRKMDDPNSSCKVSVVVMLALTEPHAHLDMLQKVVALVRDQELVGRLLASQDEDEAFALVEPTLM